MTTSSKVKTSSAPINAISIIPNQLIVRQYSGEEDSLYVYPSIFDIKSDSQENFDRFVVESQRENIFDYRNSGKAAIDFNWTFDDGSENASWFLLLCKLCKHLDSSGIPVEIVFDFNYLFEMEVQFANANFTDTSFYSDEETRKIVASYIWYFQKIVEKCGLKYRMDNLHESNNLKIERVYTLDVYKDAFRISGPKNLIG